MLMTLCAAAHRSFPVYGCGVSVCVCVGTGGSIIRACCQCHSQSQIQSLPPAPLDTVLERVCHLFSCHCRRIAADSSRFGARRDEQRRRVDRRREREAAADGRLPFLGCCCCLAPRRTQNFAMPMEKSVEKLAVAALNLI